MPITWYPSLIKRSHKWDPKNPAAPVMSIRLRVMRLEVRGSEFEVWFQ